MLARHGVALYPSHSLQMAWIQGYTWGEEEGGSQVNVTMIYFEEQQKKVSRCP